MKSNIRMLNIIRTLANHAADGLRPGQLAKELKVDPATITRDMNDLSSEGFAERVPGREEAWRLGPRAVQIFRAHCMGLEKSHQRMAELEHRISREL